MVVDKWRPKRGWSELSVEGVNWDGETMEGEREGMPIPAVEVGMAAGAGISGRPPRRMEIVPLHSVRERLIEGEGMEVLTEVGYHELGHVTTFAGTRSLFTALAKVHLEFVEHLLEDFSALQCDFAAFL